MPRDTNGNTQPLPGTIVSNGDTILPSQHNPALVDLYAMMTQSLSRDGQGGMRAPLDMSGFPIQNVGASTGPTGVATVQMVNDSRAPVGVLYDWVGSTAPVNHMLCYGQAVSRVTYADLFIVIGTAFGTGDGSTTFNLPDFRGRVSAGKDNMGGTAAGRLTSPVVGTTLGATGGAQSHVLTDGQMPSHQHSGSTSVAGAHSHALRVGGGGPGGVAGATGSDPNSFTSTDGNHTHTFTTDIRGSDQAHPNVQPTIILNKIIKVSY